MAEDYGTWPPNEMKGYALINQDGTLERGGGIVLSVNKTGTGVYDLTIPTKWHQALRTYMDASANDTSPPSVLVTELGSSPIVTVNAALATTGALVDIDFGVVLYFGAS